MILAVVGPGVPAQVLFGSAADREQMLASLRRTAVALPFVEPGALSYGRPAHGPAPSAALAAHRAAVEAAASLAGDLAGLQPLLDDADPKVRLMAAYGLFRGCDPASLPLLAKLVDDAGELPSLQSMGMTMQMAEAYRRELPPLGTTTVGVEVRGFLAAWGAAEPGSTEFATWSARQQELAPTAAELLLRLRLVCRGSLPIAASPLELLDVFSHVGRAPPGAREIAMIGLFHDKVPNLVGRYPTIERALDFAARRLGHDNLLRLLRGEAPRFDGEALPPERLDGLVEAAQDFVLARPMQVGLEPEDADALIAIGRQTDRHAMFRAAAMLRPERATEILRQALARTANPLAGDERVECAIRLWELRPTENREFLAEWFFTHVEPMHFAPAPRSRFAVHLLSGFGAADRDLFARLALDPRFDRVEPFALLTIVRTLNLTQMQPVVPEASLANFSHPLGLDSAFRDVDAARQSWPRETQTMLARMADWRQLIRAHVAPWRRDD